jgi:hypothetical protein
MKDFTLKEILLLTGLIDERKCAKQEVIAVIITPKLEIFVGSNWCETPQKECPRKDMPTGVGYEMCRDICKQRTHAEIDACQKAGANAVGADLYLMGHTYCCDHCKEVMEAFGIKNIRIWKKPNG